jgi:RNA polymerase sigma-70 factor (ECF subfamily)
VAFVLHDLFSVPFEEIGPIVGRSPEAARKLASRARRRVQGQGAGRAPDADLASQRGVIDAFLAALRDGDLEALVAVLDPDFVIRADAAAAPPGAPREVRGARTWARQALAFSRGLRFAEPALVDGAVGVVVAPRGRLFRVLRFTIAGGKIARMDVVADGRLRDLDLAALRD